MKKLFTAVLSAAAIAVPFFSHANTAPQTEQSAVQPEKAKGVWIDVRSAEIDPQEKTIAKIEKQ